MIATHTFTAVTKCPVEDCPDVLEVTITTDRTVMIEDVLAASKSLEKDPITQEAYTIHLATALGVQVTTVGVRHNVRTEVVHGQLETTK